MKDYIGLALILAGVGFYFMTKQPQTDPKDLVIEQQYQRIQTLEAEQRGMERALGLSR
ncbi:hypothetical protein NDI44_28095 [Trichocoleus sp. DQ-A3]|uniref:hypothetical protein n=1 Tax=Cyanophyceae TaxID=3028117 RepID=UPI001684FB97|nr:hypothetical protein [Coleofasciculus sp. FACHB-125]MBD1903749.1 hypothetical protein [Coleofasciculus sp. FACHB-125]